MRLRQTAIPAIILAGLLPASAAADEIYGGGYVHGVDTPFSLDTGEGGADVHIGYRMDPVTESLGGPQPYVFGSLNTQGDTSYAGVGVSWKAEIGKVYLRPGVGLVIHDGPSLRFDPVTLRRTDLGSRVLFEPEIALGVDLDSRWSVEASWVHISNGQIFDSEQNPGIDTMGVRLNYRM